MKGVSIRLKVIFIIVLSLALTILAVLYLSTTNQRESLIAANEQLLATSTSMLNITIRNIMLDGEAPLAVRTLQNLHTIPEIEEIEIYRRDGTRAFHDYETLEIVNRNQKEIRFKTTERLPNKYIENQHFFDVIDSNSPKRVEMREQRKMDYYFPILNAPDCRKCHGADHFVRGVAFFRISTEKVYDQIAQANILLTSILGAAGLLIIVILVLFLKRIVIKPILEIGVTVNEVAKGSFATRVPVRSGDEVGRLGDEINRMIQGLEERFQLSKYVSRTTDTLIRQRREVESDGKKQNLTALFSDIRNFTSYAEKNSPGTVIKTLNSMLQTQAELVYRFGGDIDKFIGDAVMALFDNEYAAVRCAYEMIKGVMRLEKQENIALRIGIGINSGEIILGNIGSETRREYAAIGDAVNLASRLSGIAKPNMILISESVMKALNDKIRTRLIPEQQIKGKTERVNVYVVQSVLDNKTNRWLR